MTISVSGLGSGLDYDNWIKQLVAIKQADIDKISSSVKAVNTQKSTLSSLETSYTKLLDSVKSFTAALSTDSVFGQKAATSSSEAVGVSVTSSASAQNVKIEVSKLATATVAKSASVAGSVVASGTKISDIAEGNTTEGNFSIYIDGTKHSIAVDSDSTLGDVLGSITTQTGLAATVDANGKVKIGEGSTADIVIGSNADTSNFSNIMSLAKNQDGTYSSSKSIFSTDTSAKITSASFAGGKVTEGTFKIGSDEFTVDSTKTLDSLIDEINKSEDAGVSAYWDANAGKLVLESTDGGALNINVEKGSSNFTDIMKLTSDGAIATGSQALGENAKLTINGTEIIASSNTITSDISGLAGVTLTLNDETTSTANISVTNDSAAFTTAIDSFITAFNSVISKTDSVTGSSGNLYGESALTSIRNRLRTLVTSSASDGEYKSLAAIGITTGKIGTDVDTKTNQLSIDGTKLAEAMASNPDAVKQLLLGDGVTDGLFDKFQTVLDGTLDPTKGYFTTKEKSFDTKIDRLEDKIDRKTLALEKYQEQLETKFALMDKIISNFQSQADQMDSFMSSISPSNNNN